MSSWYFGSSNPLYFDMICEDSTLHRIQIVLNSDLTSASLNLINSSTLTRSDARHVVTSDYTICEGSTFSCWFDDKSVLKWYHGSDGIGNDDSGEGGIYTGSVITRFALVHPVPVIGRYLSSAASGRVVLEDQNRNFVVLDF